MKSLIVDCGRGLVRVLSWTIRTARRGLARAASAIRLGARSRPVRLAVALVFFVGKTGFWTTAFVLLGTTCLFLGFQRIPSGHVGIRQQNFGDQGLEARDTPTGIQWCPRGLEEWHLIDMRTQVLAFAWETEGGDYPMLDVRTKDGNVCNVAVTVPWRVKRGEAHAIVSEGLQNAYGQRVRSTVEKVLLQELAHLRSEDFVNTDTRLARAAAALPKLNELLAKFHVEAETILVTNFLFGMEYEKKLQQKQLTVQVTALKSITAEVEKRREENNLELAKTQARVSEIRAEEDLKIQERFVTGKQAIVAFNVDAKEYDRVRRSEAQAEYDRLVAEGERVLINAEGLKDVLAQELYDSEGGRLLLARKAAENLNIKQVMLNSNDPRVPSILDLDELVKLLVGKEGAGQ